MDFDFPYRLCQQTYHVGDQSFQLLAVEDLDKTIDEMYDRLCEAGHQEWLEEYCPYFGVLWASGTTLSEEILKLDATLLAGKEVLEIGCGLGLGGIVAAFRGALVTAMDSHPHAQNLVEKNYQLNGLHLKRYLNASFMSAPELGKFPLIIGSDILYERPMAVPLAKFVQKHLEEDGSLLLVDPVRPYIGKFVEAMTQLGYSYSSKQIDRKETVKTQTTHLYHFFRPPKP